MNKPLYVGGILAVILLLCAADAQAQYAFGVSTSDWSGSSQLELNPANIGSNPFRFTVDILSLNAGLYNNLGSLNTGGGIIGAVAKGNTTNDFAYSGNGTFSLLAPYATVHGPGCTIAINHKHSFAITTGISGFNQFNNFNSSLYKIIDDSASVPAGNIDLTSQKFNYTAQIWSYAGLSYGGVIYERGHHLVKVGATVRYLGGIGYIGLKGNNLNVHYNNAADSTYVSNSDVQFASNVLSTKSAVFNGVSDNNFLSEFLGSKGGHGVGGDVGVVYEFMQDTTSGVYDVDGKTMDDPSKSRYKLKFSASVRDLGYILYKAANNSNFEVTGNGYITGSGLSDSVSNYQTFHTYAVEHGFTADTSHQNTKVYQPTSLVIGADYSIYGHYYVNATFVANLANRQDFGNSYYDQLTITPRYDTRNLSVGVPVSYNTLAHNVMLGAAVRYHGFYIGSDDMLALVFKRQYGFNLYVGGFVPIYKVLPKGATPHRANLEPQPDMEHGGAPDTTDNCPDVIDFSVAPQSTRYNNSKEGEPVNHDAVIRREDADLYKED